MTTRTQILRSSTPGQTPAAGSRLPGELWTTFPDLQLGVIDASKNAQKLIAVRFFSTTANYAAGDFVIQAGALYVAKGAVAAGAFNGTQWTKVAAATDAGGPYLPIGGGTLTGALVLAADPGAALGAATKQYVDGKVTAAPYLPIAGGTLTGPVILSGPPTIPLHAATKAYVDAGAFVPIGGGTMTGDLILNRDPQVALGAATKQYADAKPAAMNDNRIINGDMRIDQRNNGAVGTANGYTADRWAFFAAVASKMQWQRAGVAGAVPYGFAYCLALTTTAAYTPGASETFQLYQAVEADMVTDFAWGTASAQPVVLSFWAQSTLTGTFSGSIQNYASNRSYPFTFSLPTASTWTKIVIPVPGDTGGTWVMSGNAGALYVLFDLGTGATKRGPAGAWASANYAGATGSVSVVGTNAAQFLVTGVKLEVGSVATPFNRQSLAKSMADCQRYYQGGSQQINCYAPGVGNYGANIIPFPVTMRATPTITTAWTTQSNGTGSINPINTYGMQVVAAASTSGLVNVTGTFTASAEL